MLVKRGVLIPFENHMGLRQKKSTYKGNYKGYIFLNIHSVCNIGPVLVPQV